MSHRLFTLLGLLDTALGQGERQRTVDLARHAAKLRLFGKREGRRVVVGWIQVQDRPLGETHLCTKAVLHREGVPAAEPLFFLHRPSTDWAAAAQKIAAAWHALEASVEPGAAEPTSPDLVEAAK